MSKFENMHKFIVGASIARPYEMAHCFMQYATMNWRFAHL